MQSFVNSGQNIHKLYIFQRRIGFGSFGEVWIVTNKETKVELACKVERKTEGTSFLTREIRLLLLLQNFKCWIYEQQTIIDFPKIHFYGQDETNVYLFMNLLGKNLQTIKEETISNSFSIPMILKIAKQMLKIFEGKISSIFMIVMHDEGIIHRDIKPENILFDKGRIYLIDFGLSKVFYKAIPKIQQIRGPIGTIIFTSVNSMDGFEQSRRDDLEGLFYTLVYLQLGALPWMNLHKLTKQAKYKLTRDMKQSYFQNKEWISIPESIVNILQQSRSLSFEQRPNYKALIGAIKFELKSSVCSFQQIVNCPQKKKAGTSVDSYQPSFGQKSSERVVEFPSEDEKTQIDIKSLSKQLISSEGLKKPSSPKKMETTKLDSNLIQIKMI